MRDRDFELSLWKGKIFRHFKGDLYLVDSLTVFCLVWIIYTSGVNFPVYTFRTTMGYFDQGKYIYVASALLNIILSLVLGNWIGLAGVFLATTIPRLLTTEIADGIYVFKYGLTISPKYYFGKYLYVFLLFLVNYLLSQIIVNLIF